MSVLAVGLSHHDSPAALLERVALDPARSQAMARQIAAQDDIAESVVVTTCNRIEVYAAVRTFHGALAQVGEVLAAITGVPLDELTDHLYVHYEDRAVSHLFAVACGLESMALGESQILGQVRSALSDAQRRGQAGAVLNPLFQQALRVGKRAHAETSIGLVGRSLVELGLDRVEEHLGGLLGRRAVVVGAGAMSALAAATLTRRGVAALVVVNRSADRAERLAHARGGTAVDWARLGEAIGGADVVLTCTGAPGHVVTQELIRSTRPHREGALLAVLDLAMPRDVAPGVAALPGVAVWSLTDLTGAVTHGDSAEAAVAEVRHLIAGEVVGYLTAQRAHEVGPTVAALRSRAAGVVATELDRLALRTPGLTAQQRAEVEQTVARVVDKLLHTPTVRVKQLAAASDRGDYAHALRELFDLDAHDVATVSTPPRVEVTTATRPAPGGTS